MSVCANPEILNKVLDELCKDFHSDEHLINEMGGLEPGTPDI